MSGDPTIDPPPAVITVEVSKTPSTIKISIIAELGNIQALVDLKNLPDEIKTVFSQNQKRLKKEVDGLKEELGKDIKADESLRMSEATSSSYSPRGRFVEKLKTLLSGPEGEEFLNKLVFLLSEIPEIEKKSYLSNAKAILSTGTDQEKKLLLQELARYTARTLRNGSADELYDLADFLISKDFFTPEQVKRLQARLDGLRTAAQSLARVLGGIVARQCAPLPSEVKLASGGNFRFTPHQQANPSVAFDDILHKKPADHKEVREVLEAIIRAVSEGALKKREVQITEALEQLQSQARKLDALKSHLGVKLSNAKGAEYFSINNELQTLQQQELQCELAIEAQTRELRQIRQQHSVG
jgi:hypothetical protein